MTNVQPHPARQEVSKLLGDCEIRRQRRSGPGGQHRNKVETGIYIRHLPTGIEANATEHRSQESNRKSAVERLRRKLAVAVRQPVDAQQMPSALWTSRLAKDKRIECSANHEDLAPLVAEAMDFLAAEAWDLRAAAHRLHCTSSQLLKLLRKHPAAMTALNAARTAIGLGALR